MVVNHVQKLFISRLEYYPLLLVPKTFSVVYMKQTGKSSFGVAGNNSCHLKTITSVSNPYSSKVYSPSGEQCIHMMLWKSLDFLPSGSWWWSFPTLQILSSETKWNLYKEVLGEQIFKKYFCPYIWGHGEHIQIYIKLHKTKKCLEISHLSNNQYLEFSYTSEAVVSQCSDGSGYYQGI